MSATDTLSKQHGSIVPTVSCQVLINYLVVGGVNDFYANETGSRDRCIPPTTKEMCHVRGTNHQIIFRLRLGSRGGVGRVVYQNECMTGESDGRHSQYHVIAGLTHALKKENRPSANHFYT